MFYHIINYQHVSTAFAVIIGVKVKHSRYRPSEAQGGLGS